MTRLWLEEEKLTLADLKIMQKRANQIQVPTDIGRLLSKINMRESFFE